MPTLSSSVPPPPPAAYVNRLLRGLAAFAIGLAATVVATQLATRDSRPAPGTMLGTLDVPKYCRTMYGERAQGIQEIKSPFGWLCWERPKQVPIRHRIDFDAACDTMFGPGAYAEPSFSVSPYLWNCHAGPRPDQPSAGGIGPPPATVMHTGWLEAVSSHTNRARGSVS